MRGSAAQYEAASDRFPALQSGVTGAHLSGRSRTSVGLACPRDSCVLLSLLQKVAQVEGGWIAESARPGVGEAHWGFGAWASLFSKGP